MTKAISSNRNSATKPQFSSRSPTGFPERHKGIGNSNAINPQQWANREEVQERDNHAASFTKMLFHRFRNVAGRVKARKTQTRQRPVSNRMQWGMPIPTSKSGSVRQNLRGWGRTSARHRLPYQNVTSMWYLIYARTIVLSGWIQCYLKYSYPILNELIKRQRNR